MADAERSVLIKLGAKLGPQGKRALGQLRKGIGGLGKVAKKALNFGRILAIGGAAAFGAFLAKGVVDARSFGAAMSQVSTLVDTTQVSMASLRKEVLELSKATGKGPEDLAKALFQAISAGVDAGDAMKFLAQSTKLAVAGFATVTDVVDLGTNVINAYALEVSEMGRISDIAFAAQKEGKTTITELAQSMGNVLPFAAQLNVSLEDLFAAVSTLTKGGIETVNAVTFLKNVFVGVIKPTAQAAKAAKEMGINLTEAGFKAKGFAAFLKQLEEATGGSSEALAKIFPNIRGLAAVLSLAGKQSAEFARQQEVLAESTGVVDEALNKVNNEGFLKFDKALNDLKIIGIEAGTKIMPGLSRALKALSPFIAKAAGFMGDLAESIAIVAEKSTGVVDFLRKTGILGALAPGVDAALGVSEIGGDPAGRGATGPVSPRSAPEGFRRAGRTRAFEAARRRAAGTQTDEDLRRFGADPFAVGRRAMAKALEDASMALGEGVVEALEGNQINSKEQAKRFVDRKFSQQMGLAPL